MGVALIRRGRRRRGGGGLGEEKRKGAEVKESRLIGGEIRGKGAPKKSFLFSEQLLPGRRWWFDRAVGCTSVMSSLTASWNGPSWLNH
jgi:hypothetical protein